MATVFVGIGSNIHPEANLKACAALLRGTWPEIDFSTIWRTKALLHEDQNDFLNGVARFEAEESPEEVFEILRSIEEELGKNPPFRYGPRTIDVDLLLYGDLTMKTEDLTIPHPKMRERRFVLEPLCELNSAKRWKTLLQKTKEQDCRETTMTWF